MFGFVLIKNKELQKYKDEIYKDKYVKQLKKQRDMLINELADIKNNPVDFFRGRRYSKEIIRELNKIFEVLK